MKQIPILFNTEMIISKMAGRKTQTRRIINPQPSKQWAVDTFCKKGPGSVNSSDLTAADSEIDELLEECPYGQKGDVLWTRETYAQIITPEKQQAYIYKADDDLYKDYIEDWQGWMPSIFMPKSACRMWDEAVSIRVERVAEISEEDAIAEGISFLSEEFGYKDYSPFAGIGPMKLTAKESYRSLWQKINGTPRPLMWKIDGKMKPACYEVYPFDEEAARPFAGLTEWRGKPLTVIVNPWVFVIEFKPINKPENFIS